MKGLAWKANSFPVNMGGAIEYGPILRNEGVPRFTLPTKSIPWCSHGCNQPRNFPG
jgi:hypothetical protein